MKFIDNLDSKLDGGLISELKEKIAEFNNSFESKVEPKDGLYGTVERIKDNGTIVEPVLWWNGDVIEPNPNTTGVHYKTFHVSDLTRSDAIIPAEDSNFA